MAGTANGRPAAVRRYGKAIIAVGILRAGGCHCYNWHQQYANITALVAADKFLPHKAAAASAPMLALLLLLLLLLASTAARRRCMQCHFLRQDHLMVPGWDNKEYCMLLGKPKHGIGSHIAGVAYACCK